MLKKALLLFFISLTVTVYSQQPEKLIFGKVIDSAGAVKNANIINLRNNKGTSSNDYGEFKIIVKAGDSLRVSSIQYKTKYFLITKFSIDNNRIDVRLNTETQELEEFILKRTELLGILGIDGKKVPKSVKDSLLNETMDFSDVIWHKWDIKDYTNSRVKPNQVVTDPTANFVGAGAAIVMPFKNSKKYWALVKELKFKESFPQQLFLDFGAVFFLVDLKIPPERYYHFLEYCNPLGIESLYQNNKKLEVLKILQRESKSYLKIINKEKE